MKKTLTLLLCLVFFLLFFAPVVFATDSENNLIHVVEYLPEFSLATEKTRLYPRKTNKTDDVFSIRTFDDPGFAGFALFKLNNKKTPALDMGLAVTENYDDSDILYPGLGMKILYDFGKRGSVYAFVCVPGMRLVFSPFEFAFSSEGLRNGVFLVKLNGKIKFR